MISGGFDALALARESGCNAESGEPDVSGRGIDEHVGRLDVLVNEATSVKPAKCGRQGHCESQKSIRFPSAGR